MREKRVLGNRYEKEIFPYPDPERFKKFQRAFLLVMTFFSRSDI